MTSSRRRRLGAVVVGVGVLDGDVDLVLGAERDPHAVTGLARLGGQDEASPSRSFTW